jgi:diacylglycerol kinase family enzyme
VASLPCMSHVALIVNPLATAVDEHRVALVERTLAQHANVDTHLTRHAGHATELAREVASEVEAIFVLSGDGGFNEVVNGLGPSSPPVGCIPGGGTSVFPRVLGLSREPVQAAERLAEAFREGRTRRISVGRVNGRRFLFNAGIRFDAELVRRIEANRSRDGRPGDAAFLATVVKLIAEHRGRFEPILDVEGAGRASFVLVANADPYTYLGSIPIHVAPSATLDSGLHLVAPADVHPWTIPRLARFVVSGKGLPASVHVVRDTDRIEVRCDRPLPLQADGEDLGDVTEAVFEAERRAVTVLY